MTRWKKTVRRRLAIGGAALTIGASILFVVGVLPASAHSALLSGRTVCGNGTHVIRWSIGNDYGLPMTITSASATKGTTSYAVTGYHATVGPVGGTSDTTSATTVVPGSATGNVTLRVHARWSDGFTASASTSVSLIGPCGSTGSTTTTTLVTQGSTLPPPTTTSTIASVGSTVAAPTTGPPTSNSASNGGTPVGPLGGPTRPSGGSSIARQLPFTGSGYVGPMLGVGSLVLGGVAVAAGSARKRRRETM
ncbi:MAG TPA: hypothetical protein VEZ15_11080 [Acidimicrobiia bacterium]|nr:hypothetical protein [Acidimicrobiia bacterium]